MNIQQWTLVVFAAPWLGACLAALVGPRRRLPEIIALVCAVVCSVGVAIGARRGDANVEPLVAPWIPALGISFSVRLDALAVPFALNTMAVTCLALAYGWDYFRNVHHRHLCYALMLAFLGSMLGSVLAADVFLFFILWEVMLVASSLLLAGWGDGDRVWRVTLSYFIYTQGGSLLILLGLASLVSLAGSSDMTVIASAVQGIPPSELLPAAELLLLGFAVKMAIVPFHTWLPDAHSIAPMPATIMLAASMLAMGVYGIARLPMGILWGTGVREFKIVLMALALGSVLLGGIMCLVTTNIKRLVAYSSVSQMGYILFALTTLAPLGVTGGILHVLAHGWVKAAMFMGVGLIRQTTGRWSLEELGGLLRTMPGVVVGLGLAALALAGTPVFGSFVSEWLIFVGALSAAPPLLADLLLLSPVLTAAYGLLFVYRLALGSERADVPAVTEPPLMRVAFYAALAGVVLMGFVPLPFYRWASAAAALVAQGG